MRRPSDRRRPGRSARISRLAPGDDHEGAEDQGVGDVPRRAQRDDAMALHLPDRDPGGDQQEHEGQHLRDDEVERRRSGPGRAGDVPLLLAPQQRVGPCAQVDRERDRREHQHLPAEAAERRERQQDLHQVEARVDGEPLPHADVHRHRVQVEVDLHRRDEQQQAGRDPGEVVRRRDRVHDALVERQVAPPRERVAPQQDLEAAGRPAQLLLGVGLDGLGGVTDGEGACEVDAAPAPLVQLERRPDVLGLGVRVDPADLVHRVAPEHHVGADAERRVEVVATGLDEAVEDGLHVARAAGDHGVQVAVGLRRLDEGHVVVGEERQDLLDELGPRHEVGVEDGEEVTLGLGQGMVDVAGLGAGTAAAAQVEAAELVGELPHAVRAAVVEEPGAVGPADRERGGRACDVRPRSARRRR